VALKSAVPNKAAAALTCVALLFGGTLVAAQGAQAATKSHEPIGRIDFVKQNGAGLTAQGWAFDPDTKSPIKVAIYVDGRAATAKRTASLTRNDLARFYRSAGTRHGFRVSLGWKSGTHRVCVKAFNVGKGSARSAWISCRTLKIIYNPVGTVDSVIQVPGGLQITGWAFDPTSPRTTVRIALSVTGATAAVPAVTASTTATGVSASASALKISKATTVASLRRVALAKAHPEAGGNHGYSVKFAAPNGTYRVCATAKNLGKGVDTRLACKSVTLDFSPRGAITSLVQAPGGLTVSGWTLDPDSTAALSVNVVIDGKTVETTTANENGAKNGYSLTRTYHTTAGAHTVCLYAYNVGQGSNKTVACQGITLDFNPTVQISSLAQTFNGTSGIAVSGWAVDPDVSAAVTVNYSLDGSPAGSGTANGSGIDHSGHRYAVTLPVSTAGLHTVCVAAINLSYGTPGPGTPDCQSISVNLSPTGGLGSAARGTDGTSIALSGWALDLGTASPINVVPTIDGVAQPAALANVSAPYLAAPFPGYGTNHGYVIALARPDTDGEHTVCVTAINVGAGADVSLGCAIVIAVHPVPPSLPQNVVAVAGYGGAIVNWTASTDDGGAPVSSYTVSSSPGGVSVVVASSLRQRQRSSG
jgi:hypothetical protein